MNKTPRTDAVESRITGNGGRIAPAITNLCRELETELAEAKTELAELESLFELQHKRSLEAMKLWQDAHNEPDVWPDLGKLLTWLLERGQGCFSCKYGPMCSKKPAVCSGCSFAMKDPADGVSRWEPKEAERCKIHRAD